MEERLTLGLTKTEFEILRTALFYYIDHNGGFPVPDERCNCCAADQKYRYLQKEPAYANLENKMNDIYNAKWAFKPNINSSGYY